MGRLGLEPRVAGWKAPTNPLRMTVPQSKSPVCLDELYNCFHVSDDDVTHVFLCL